MQSRTPIKLKIQIMCGDQIAMGPGKADLLEAIAASRSISAAGRALGMSYRRTWLLVDTMNRCWAEPLVATVPGNPKAGAHLTGLGEAIFAQYRELQGALEKASSTKLTAILDQSLLPAPRPAQRDGKAAPDAPNAAT